MDTSPHRPLPHASAFDAVMPAVARWARRAIARILPRGHAITVDDVLQDVFVAWVEDDCPHADDPVALESFLRGVTIYKARDARRAVLARAKHDADLPDAGDLRPSADDPERDALARELLARLTDDDRALVVAHAVDDRSFPELAAAASAKPWTLRRLCTRWNHSKSLFC